jgi:Peptidase family M1 domain/Peptidase M1 N-terminal domain
MPHRLAGAIIAVVCLFVSAASASAADRTVYGGFSAAAFAPGAPGIGDPYFPLDGNGGYDVRHYLLDFDYAPAADRLTGVATIRAKATQNLSSFNLDLTGLTVRSITVDGHRADWSRDADELTVIPRRRLRAHSRFTTVLVYDGVPQPVGDAEIGLSGFLHTDDGTVVAGQPDAAATWYPVNDHPLDKASYTFRITVPAGVEAIANGELRSNRTRGGSTTWVWNAREPMASYLTTATIGQFDVHAYRAHGIRYWDAIDPDLFTGATPRSGEKFALAQVGNLAYKRLARTVDVPAEGGRLSFWVTRDTERDWDFMFVEARPAGSADWTTLPDLNGHSSAATGELCSVRLGLHPFLTHYLTDNGDGTCSPTGSTGTWSAASGASDGYEHWAVDLSQYAGTPVEVSISYVSDDAVQRSGVFVDDVTVPGGAGSTSFEADGHTFDGWTVPGAPEGSEPNPNDWIAGTAADVTTVGTVVRDAFARQPQILDFLSGLFGRYPFSAAGGIVDDLEGLEFALETQTRPVYSKDFFTSDFADPHVTSVVVHELAHQWTGNDVAVAAWQHIWLNEGFATYTEWLWSEHEGREPAQFYFDFYTGIPAASPFWSVKIGDPGPDALFHGAVYDRGAATLHALRLRVGDEAFFRILKQWIRSQAGGNATIPEFIAVAERVSRQSLDAFFDEWLFTSAKPASLPAAAAGATSAAGARRPVPSASAVPHPRRGPALRR